MTRRLFRQGPHPRLAKHLVAGIQKVIDLMPDIHCEDPRDGEQFPWPNQALDRSRTMLFNKDLRLLVRPYTRRLETRLGA